jgi:hypothetical protein
LAESRRCSVYLAAQPLRVVLRPQPQMVVMAAIVATVLFAPVGGVLALLAFLLAGISLQDFVTFGGALSASYGLVLWWAVMLVPAIVYAAFVMPRPASPPTLFE